MDPHIGLLCLYKSLGLLYPADLHIGPFYPPDHHIGPLYPPDPHIDPLYPPDPLIGPLYPPDPYIGPLYPPGSEHSAPLIVKYHRMQQVSQRVILMFPFHVMRNQVSFRCFFARHVWRTTSIMG